MGEKNNLRYGCVFFVKCELVDKIKDLEMKRNLININSDYLVIKKFVFIKFFGVFIKRELDNEFDNDVFFIEFGGN